MAVRGKSDTHPPNQRCGVASIANNAKEFRDVRQTLLLLNYHLSIHQGARGAPFLLRNDADCIMDDITFGASVWATDEPPAASLIAVKSEPTGFTQFDDAGFDDFDDFGAPSEATQEDMKDDDEFGDFGDFGEADESSSTAFGDPTVFDNDIRIAGPSSQNWRPLQLDPFPSRSSLEAEINETLAPIWNYEDIAVVTTDEPIREAEGVAQILLTQSRCENTLIAALGRSPANRNFFGLAAICSNYCFKPLHPQNLQTGRVPAFADSILSILGYL